MRKAIVSALMIALLLLPGCGEREKELEESFEALRGAVTRAESISFQTEMTAERGDTEEQYTLAVAYDGRQTQVEILAPELIAGIRASAGQGQTELRYDGAVLGVGPLDQEGTTPMSAMPVMLDAIASAYVELLWWEEDTLAARLFVGQSGVLTLWVDSQTLTPLAAEIAQEGRTLITCHITDWQIA